ncbi:MAG: GAF domain-containing protein [Elusimicrobia bacterium]|nr:GAF domain-containing protein [Elusimicrobiota bacterium]
MTEVSPGIEKDPADWIGKYGEVALHNKEVRFEQYSQPLGRYYSVSAYSPTKNYFAVMFMDVTERKHAEEELRRSYEIQNIINYLLQIQIEGFSLQNILEGALKKILSLKWLAIETRGAIFLASEDGKKLVLKVQFCLSEFVCTKCKEVKFGECMCGRAALSGKVEFSSCLDERHTVRYEGIAEHGHYCVPIISNGKTLGVINTYLKQGHIRDEKEVEFLSVMANILAGIIGRKKNEQERENLHLQLLKSSRLASVGELASGLAHEIGNPLQTVLGNAELLLMDTQNEELLAIKNAALHCKKIIENLLDFSRQREMNFVLEDINKLLEKTLSLYGKQLELKNIKIVKNYGVIPKIIVSPSHIEQVFLNIITNAEKAMPNGGTLTIRTCSGGIAIPQKLSHSNATATSEPSFIEISFKDTGIGISKENLSRLFEPFFTTKKDGTGLGLSVSYGIVKQHGGEILAFSNGENKGAEFVIKLLVKFAGGG